MHSAMAEVRDAKGFAVLPTKEFLTSPSSEGGEQGCKALAFLKAGVKLQISF